MPAKPRLHSPEDDLAFMRSIVEGGGGSVPMTLAVCYLAGGLLYGLQCLFHLGQVFGIIDWPDLANLLFVVAIARGDGTTRSPRRSTTTVCCGARAASRCPSTAAPI